ncbi:type II secretion system F family protein [Arthrobacter zhaoxinii]|uniref:Type II secretion system F family protein n=1 Tax=Arthrobacter zhaoxinii TaxID=2964616 RepID=A0ABY5YPC6_9MICC|nr:type II secretion system F family protein [Arthrobacter zhaoxinii]UWX96677.1 type II secretion system F family protein [Arthrobacter zhaoxinii]
MTGLTVAVLLATAAALMIGFPPPRPQAGSVKSARTAEVRVLRRRRYPGLDGDAPASKGEGRLFRRRRIPRLDGDAPALLVRELAGLLAAGRSAHRIWADAATLYEAPGPAGTSAHPFFPVLQAAAASAALGLSPVPVLAAAERGNGATDPALQQLWSGLAVCLRVSERSGAPLATVLSRYAGQLEAARDAAADREAAMAGPRATMRLLTWLPGGGILLGYLLGGNPLQILTATPLGWVAAAAGSAFWLAGRLWSARLVRNAQAPVQGNFG